MPESMRYEDFLARRASDCSLRCSAGDAAEQAFPAVLAEVGERGQRQGYEHFSLLFHAETAATPQQGSYAVTFADGVCWEIFLVPVAREGARVVYEAVFNRTIAA
jgi:uncharacterized protein DUF6916